MSSVAATVAVIGVGGMGLRYLAACRLIGARVVAVCDRRPEALGRAAREVPEAVPYASAQDLIDTVASTVDLVCVVTNTPDRASLLHALIAGGARRVITEKPFATRVADAHAIETAYRAAHVPLTVNTYRHFCPNHLRLRELLRGGAIGSPRHVSIQSGSTGLGNMGSVFFDLMNFYLESVPLEVTGVIDRTCTPNPRGAQFVDPGGYGMVRYANGGRGFIDTSEDTGVPYVFHMSTTLGRVMIDEVFNKWSVAGRCEADRSEKPLTFYLAPLVERPFELTHVYDPVEMTSFTLTAALNDCPEARNAAAAVQVTEMIMALHVSDSLGRVPVSLPLDCRYHGLEIPFA